MVVIQVRLRLYVCSRDDREVLLTVDIANFGEGVLSFHRGEREDKRAEIKEVSPVVSFLRKIKVS